MGFKRRIKKANRKIRTEENYVREKRVSLSETIIVPVARENAILTW
jgi:hypothetical protein